MAQTTSNDGFQLLSQGDFRSARDIFSSLVANRQDLAQANYGLGVIALMEHNPSLARHHFGDCLNYDPQHSNALFQLGFIEKQAGNDQGATQFWQRCLQANPRHVGALKALGLPEPQANLPLPATTPPQTFSGTSTSPGDAIGGYDLYGLLKRCNSRNDHLWLMSRDLVLVKRSLFNRFTNDGSLFLGPYRYKGFFSGSQLTTIQKSFSQLKVIMPTNREVLAAIGELKQMRTGDK